MCDHSNSLTGICKCRNKRVHQNSLTCLTWFLGTTVRLRPYRGQAPSFGSQHKSDRVTAQNRVCRLVGEGKCPEQDAPAGLNAMPSECVEGAGKRTAIIVQPSDKGTLRARLTNMRRRRDDGPSVNRYALRLLGAYLAQAQGIKAIG